MSIFKIACQVCGLSSVSVAADFFGVSESTMKHWWAGRRPVPDGVWQTLATLYDQIIEVSEHALDTLELSQIEEVDIDAFAEHEHGSKLPAPAKGAALAMFILTRIADADA